MAPEGAGKLPVLASARCLPRISRRRDTGSALTEFGGVGGWECAAIRLQ